MNAKLLGLLLLALLAKTGEAATCAVDGPDCLELQSLDLASNDALVGAFVLNHQHYGVSFQSPDADADLRVPHGSNQVVVRKHNGQSFVVGHLETSGLGLTNFGAENFALDPAISFLESVEHRSERECVGHSEWNIYDVAYHTLTFRRGSQTAALLWVEEVALTATFPALFGCN